MAVLSTGLWAVDQSGFVRSGGQAIPGATVRVSKDGKPLGSTITDEEGKWTLEGFPEGLATYTFEIEMFGFQTKKVDLAVPAHPSALEFELTLRPPQGPRPGMRRGGPGGARQAAFQSTELNRASAEEALPEAPPPAVPADTESTEAFLVQGSMSRGLAPPRPDAPDQQEPVFRGPGGPEGQGPGGPGGPGGGPGGGFRGGPGGGGPGGGGPGGGFGGGGFGGGGFGGRGGGPGGGFRGRPGGPGRPGANANFGNRRRQNEGIRGNFFFTARNSALDARPYSLTGQTVDKPDYAQNRFGLSLGGPLKIGKLIRSESTFFFINYFGTRASQPFNATATVPSLLERGGDFTQSVVQQAVTVYDPSSHQPFPGNLIPKSRMDAAALGLLPYIPLPNQVGRVQNYQYVTSVDQNTDNLNVRVNQPVSKKDRISVNFGFQNRGGTSAQPFQFLDTSSGRGMNVDLSWSRTFSKTLVNNLRLTFNRNRSQMTPYFAYKTDVAALLGIRGTDSTPVNYGPPNLSFTNFGGLTDASPTLRRDQNVAVNEGLTIVKGTHNLTMGGEYRRIQLNNLAYQNARGSFSFSGLLTSGFDSAGQPLPGTGYDFADYLLGFAQSSSVRFGGDNTYFRAHGISAFAQDDWRIAKNFSINMGLRYEYTTPYQEKYGRIANLDIAPGFTGVAVVTPDSTGPYTGAIPATLINQDRNNLAPRIGLAWRPFAQRRLQIRSGYGIYYNNSAYATFAQRLASQPPFAQTVTLTTSVARPLTLQNGLAALPTQNVTNTYAVDRDYRLAYAQTWNFSVQTDLPASLVIEAGYLATKGTRLDIQRAPNRALPGSPLTAEQRRLIGNAVGFTFDSADGNSIFHSGQLRLTRRFKKGVSANLFYTYGRSIDNSSTFGGAGNTVAQNDHDLHAERGLSSFDIRHQLSLNYVLTSPFGPGAAPIPATGWTGRLLADWTLSGGLTYRSGTPITARVLGNRSDSNGSGVVGSGRAQATGLPVDSDDGFFNLLAFTLPPAGAYGNAGRNTIPGPSLLALNASFGRGFRLKDRKRLEFRLEANNVLNQVSYSGFSAVVNAVNYGLATNTAAMRTMSATCRFRW